MGSHNSRAAKSTRRVTIGWNHKARGSTTYKVVPSQKGGGRQAVDIPKSLSLNDATDLVTNHYFPNGGNTASGLVLSELNHHIANVRGEKLWDAEETVSFGEYVDRLAIKPICLCLHTEYPPESIEQWRIHEVAEECEEREYILHHVHVVNVYGDGCLPEDIEEPDEPAIYDDDEDVQDAIIDNMEEEHPDETLQKILNRWISQTKQNIDESSYEWTATIVVQRERVLESTIRGLSMNNLDITGDFKVVFSGEDGEDAGGPKREFLKCLMSEVQSEILHGGDRNKVFLHDLGKLAANRYHLAGKLVAFSILHGGPGLPILNTEVYRLMTGREMCTIPDMECVVDIEDRNKLTKIKDAQTDEDYIEAFEECTELCLDRGLSTFRSYRQLNKKYELLKILLTNELLYRVHGEVTQFTKGLDEVGKFYKTLMMAPDVLQPLFVPSDNMTFESLRQMYVIDYSSEGSNNRRLEKNVVYCFEAFLADCELGSTEVSLGDVLAFWTGADSVPLFGFSSPLHIDFIGGEGKQLPSASTCGMVLHLWRGYCDAELFARDFVISIQMGGGFYLN